MSTTTPKTCHTIKRDGNWCSRTPVVSVDGKGYCSRHTTNADGRAYPPVSDKRIVTGR